MADLGRWADVLAEAMTALDDCAAYVVVVTDRASEEVDAYGPLTGLDALDEAERVRRDLRAQRLGGVTVRVVRLHACDTPVWTESWVPPQ